MINFEGQVNRTLNDTVVIKLNKVNEEEVENNTVKEEDQILQQKETQVSLTESLQNVPAFECIKDMNRYCMIKFTKNATTAYTSGHGKCCAPQDFYSSGCDPLAVMQKVDQNGQYDAELVCSYQKQEHLVDLYYPDSNQSVQVNSSLPYELLPSIPNQCGIEQQDL